LASETPEIALVIPALNEAAEIAPPLAAARRALQRAGLQAEILVADGGSSDATAEIARRAGADRIVSCPPGRARQMNAAARASPAPWLLFLHADARLDDDALVLWASLPGRPRDALYVFTLAFRAAGARWRRLERAVAARVLRLGLPFGDQGFLLHRALYDALGGFREEALMEDLDFVLTLRGRGRVLILPAQVSTSTRQWDRQGFFWAEVWNVGRAAAGVAARLLSDSHAFALWVPFLLRAARGGPPEGAVSLTDALRPETFPSLTRLSTG
jgi:rSAM/selenodomain-associated transferase 2